MPAARSDDHAAAGNLAHLLAAGLANVVVQEGLHGERGGPGGGVSVAHAEGETNGGWVRRKAEMRRADCFSAWVFFFPPELSARILPLLALWAAWCSLWPDMRRGLGNWRFKPEFKLVTDSVI